MTIYLNNLNIGCANSSYLKSSGKLMPFYFILLFILFKFHTRMGLSIQFFPSNDKTLPHLYFLDLLYVTLNTYIYKYMIWVKGERRGISLTGSV